MQEAPDTVFAQIIDYEVNLQLKIVLPACLIKESRTFLNKPSNHFFTVNLFCKIYSDNISLNFIKSYKNIYYKRKEKYQFWVHSHLNKISFN